MIQTKLDEIIEGKIIEVTVEDFAMLATELEIDPLDTREYIPYKGFKIIGRLYEDTEDAEGDYIRGC